MPRPHRYVNGVKPEDIAREYAEGRSTRELEAKYKLSRWCLTAWIQSPSGMGGDGTKAMRSKDDALERRRWFDSLEAERQEAEACCWWKCSLPADDGTRLCVNHWLDVAEHEGRGCSWMPHCYERAVGQNLCDYHLRRANGEISG